MGIASAHTVLSSRTVEGIIHNVLNISKLVKSKIIALITSIGEY